jgi:uncharacterized protein
MSGVKQQGRARGANPAARPASKPAARTAAGLSAPPEAGLKEQEPRENPGEEKDMTTSLHENRIQTQPAAEGIAVFGEAVRRAAPDRAEFLVEVTAGGATGSQAMQNHQTKTEQMAQAVSPLGVQRTDLQTVSLNVISAFAPMTQPMLMQPIMQGLPPFAAPNLGQGAFNAFSAPQALQPEVHFGTYQARSLLRVNVREAGRAAEIVDSLVKAGGTLASGLSYHGADEAGTRRSALEAAGKEARMKAETLAATAGKKLGGPVAISEDVTVSNGAYSALRAQMPWAFGQVPQPAVGGELEFYARVTASFRFE